MYIPPLGGGIVNGEVFHLRGTKDDIGVGILYRRNILVWRPGLNTSSQYVTIRYRMRHKDAY